MEFVMSPHVFTFVLIVAAVSFIASCVTLVVIPHTTAMYLVKGIVFTPVVLTALTAWFLRNVA